MSLSAGAFQVLFIIQKFVPPSILVDRKRKLFMENPLKLKPHIYRSKLLTEFTLLIVFFPITLFYTGWLLLNWKSYTISNIYELIVYSMLTCWILVYLPVCILFHTESKSIIEHLNNSCHLRFPLKQVDQKNSKHNTEALFRKLTFKPFFAYCVVVSFK